MKLIKKKFKMLLNFKNKQIMTYLLISQIASTNGNLIHIIYYYLKYFRFKFYKF